MHSKLIRLQTALLTLALLFTVLIPVSAYAEGETAAAQATADGSTTISDPNTLNAWERTQAYNNATTGRIWADKTVVKDKIDLPSQGSIAVPKDDKDADFLVALSALSSCVYHHHQYTGPGYCHGAGCLRQYEGPHGRRR